MQPPPIGNTCIFTRNKTKQRVQLQERKRESCGSALFHRKAPPLRWLTARRDPQFSEGGSGHLLCGGRREAFTVKLLMTVIISPTLLLHKAAPEQKQRLLGGCPFRMVQKQLFVACNSYR